MIENNTFDDLYTSYMELLKSLSNYIECLRIQTQLESFQDVTPIQQTLLAKMPKPIYITYMEMDLSPSTNFEFTFTLHEYHQDYRMRYSYDHHRSQWIFKSLYLKIGAFLKQTNIRQHLLREPFLITFAKYIHLNTLY